MKNDPLVAKLYNKMQQEQNEYRAWLLAQPPEEILNHAYEYSSREDILIALENASLRPAQLRALFACVCGRPAGDHQCTERFCVQCH